MSGSRRTVSVVLTVYNATWCIERALDSLMAQTVPPDEILVCDDGSTDGTPELVERRYGDGVTVLRLPHRNAAATRGVGLARARSDWLAFMDADDTWRPAKNERQLDFVSRHPDVRWCGTDGEYVTDTEVLRDSWLSDYFLEVRDMTGDLMPALVQRCFPLMSSMLVDREAYHAVGGINPDIVYSHDYDLWLRLSARYPGAQMADRLVKYWSSPNALSKRVEARYRDDLAILRRVAAGELRRDPQIVSAARVRVAAHAFDLGVLCLRTDRVAEGRRLLADAAAAGPWSRRVFAMLGRALPAGWIPALMRSSWLKSRVSRARAPVVRMDTGGPRS